MDSTPVFPELNDIIMKVRVGIFTCITQQLCESNIYEVGADNKFLCEAVLP